MFKRGYTELSISAITVIVNCNTFNVQWHDIAQQ